MRKLIALAKWLDNHWLGDLIGVACLFATGWLALVIGYGLGY